MPDAYTEEERYLRGILADLQNSYLAASKPYLDRLAAIEAHRPPAPMIVSIEQARELGLIPLPCSVQ